MKTEGIKQQILINYRQLSQLAKVQPQDEYIMPAWRLLYKKNGTSGFVNQIGTIERNNSSIRINGDEIQLQKKSFFLSWKRTLENINTMLQNTIENLDNKDVVTKNVVNTLSFPKEAIEILSKSAKH